MVALGAGTGNLGLAEPIRIASRLRRSRRTSRFTLRTRIERVTFYGYQLPDYIAVAHVLAAQFPEVKEQLPPEVRQFVEKA